MLQTPGIPPAIRAAALKQIAKGGYRPPEIETYVLEAPGKSGPLALMGNFH